MSLDRTFWQGRRVFVTGHTGFKGSWLVLLLKRLGAEVAGLALPPDSSPALYDAAAIESHLAQETIADIRSADVIGPALDEFKPSIVLHLAAQSLVRRAAQDPVGTFATNVMGTAHLLDAVHHHTDTEAVVVVTTDKVYDNQEWAWAYRETDRLGGKEAYGASKAASEFVCDSYRHMYFQGGKTSLATARAGNVIGGGDWAEDRLVPDAMRAFAAGKQLSIRNPDAVRPWQHVLEPLTGYLILAQWLAGGEKGEAWNFGPPADGSARVADVADDLCSLWGKGASWGLTEGQQPYEARLLTLDAAKAMQELRWRPVWGLDRTLAETVSWYRAFYGGGDAGELCGQQIDRYLKELAA